MRTGPDGGASYGFHTAAPFRSGLVDRIQVTVFPVIAAQTGDEPVFADAGDFDLDLLQARTLDGRTQELVYRPALRTWPAS